MEIERGADGSNDRICGVSVGSVDGLKDDTWGALSRLGRVWVLAWVWDHGALVLSDQELRVESHQDNL